MDAVGKKVFRKFECMNSTKVYWSLAAALTILKLILSSQNEIVAIPDDSVQYVRHAAHTVFQIGPAPGYPFWLAVTQRTGIPQRIVIELLFVFCSLVLSVVIKRSFGLGAALLVYALLLFSPATFFMFDSALSDGLYACLTILALAISCVVIFSTGLRRKIIAASICLGLVLGSMALTRNEDQILLVWGLFVLFALALRKHRAAPIRSARLVVGEVMIAGLMMLFAAGATVQAANILHYVSSGVYARSVAGLPGHMRLLDNLARIDTGEKDIRYVPISAQARRLAYGVSPTLKKFQLQIENREGPYQSASRANGIPDGEIGAGWTWHIFNQSVLDALQTSDASRWEKEYEAINGELKTAFENGALKKRFVLHTFMTAPPSTIVLRAPSAMWAVLKKSFGAHEYIEDLEYEETLFDAVTMRRSALVTGGYTQGVQGWAFLDLPGRQIRSIELGTDSGESIGGVVRMDRLDVEKKYEAVNGWQPAVLGFRVETKGREKKPFVVSYVLDDGSKITNPIPLASSGVSTLAAPGPVRILQGLDYVKSDFKERRGWRHSIQTYFVNLANRPASPLVALFILFSCASLAFLAHRSSESSSFAPIHAFLLFVVSLIIARVAFYGLLESEAWVVETRYMLAANLMLTVVAGVLGSSIFSAVKTRIASQ